MKRFLSVIAILAAAFTAFTACEEEGSGEITISDEASKELFDNGISFASTPDGGNLSASLSFDAPSPWSATVVDAAETKADSWLNVDPASGPAGQATITVTAQENTGDEDRSAVVTITSGDLSLSFNVSQQANLQQKPSVTVELDKQSAQMSVGETLELLATVLPDQEAVWFSSNENVATVVGEHRADVVGTYINVGTVTAVGEGEAVITAKAGDVSASCKVTVVGGSVVVIVTEIKLDKEEIHMSPGQTVQITASVQPEEAAGSVSWSSSQAGVASVDQEGKVTAKALGETVITASAGNKSASCLVKVESEVAIEGISLNQTSLTLKEGETFQLVATLLPETATPKPIEWTSSIPAVAIVDENGLVTAVRKGGPAMIWAIVGKGTYNEHAVKCEVTVTSDAPAVESIVIQPSPVSLKVGEETILTARVSPDGTGAAIEWKSNDPNIAQIAKISDTQAKVMGMSPGVVSVLATAGGKYAYCEVTVEKNSSSGGDVSVTLNQTELQLGFYETAQLIATVRPEGAAEELTVTWTSSNEEVVLVSNGNTPGADGSIKPAGTVIAKNKEGQAVVTATAGSASASCTVTVSSGNVVPVESISLNKTELTLKVGESFQLIATILPENATNKTVSWSMTGARSYQLSLDTNGLICGLQACEGTIWVRSAYDPANLYATCKVTVTGGGSSGTDEEVVDLGLPSGLKWRSMNVGASKPEDYGNYYAWAETSPKSSYTSSNYKYPATSYSDGITIYKKYDTTPGGDGKIVLEAEDDAATTNLGNGWRMPTFKEFKELRENCTWTWKTQNGVNGMLVTGPNGKSIFLPAGGWYDKNGLNKRGSYGSYWTATGDGGTANAVDIINNDKDKALVPRCEGRSVRPVKE